MHNFSMRLSIGISFLARASAISETIFMVFWIVKYYLQKPHSSFPSSTGLSRPELTPFSFKIFKTKKLKIKEGSLSFTLYAFEKPRIKAAVP